MSIESKVKVPGARRERRTPELARALALRSARNLLVAHGPNAVTLQAVASELGMSHTNLIHHFGSAGGLQTALMHHMVSELTDTIESAVIRFRSGEGDVADFVNIVFDAFDTGGAGSLAAWIMLSGEGQRLAPLGEVVRSYIQKVERGADEDISCAHNRVTSATLLVTIAAFGDSMIGGPLRDMVGRESDSVRHIIAQILGQLVAPAGGTAVPASVTPD
jgi:TetR/AcrR family transcriptional regulator, repressor for neighboring sulfatase